MNLPFDLVLTGGTVVSPEGRTRADVAIRGERIVAVGNGLAAVASRVVDVLGAWILPGAIDAHVHPIHGETLASVSEAAAAGGVTTIVHHVYPEPGASMLDWLRDRRAEGLRGSQVDFGFHARLRSDSPEHLLELPAVAELGVRTFKVFTTYGAPGVAAGAQELLAIMTAVRGIGGLVLVHAESDAIIERLELDSPPDEDHVTRYLRTRPDVAEAAAIREVTALARELHSPVYLVHVSSRAALDAIDEARALGGVVVAETCPHYLLLTRDALRRAGARAKIAPPLRTEGDVEALWAGVGGLRIDLVASDHCGYPARAKEPPSATFTAAGMGAPGVQTMMPLMLDAAARGLLTLERLVEVLATRPAEILGLSAKGRVAPGFDADLVVVDPAATTTVDARSLRGAAYYSLHEGAILNGRIDTVLLRGRPVGTTGAAGDARGRFVSTDPRVDRGRRPRLA